MVLLSVKPIESLLRDPSSLIVSPSEFTLQTYVDVLTSTANGGQGFGSSSPTAAFVAVGSVLLALLIGIPGAYAIARLPFVGRRKVSGLFLAAYLFPAILMAIPLFVAFTRLGLRGSLIGLVIVYTAQTVPVAIYMLRNYFETVPESPSRRPDWWTVSAGSACCGRSASGSPCRRSCPPGCSCS